MTKPAGVFPSGLVLSSRLVLLWCSRGMLLPDMAFGDKKIDLTASSPRNDSTPGSSVTAMAVGAVGISVP